MTHGRLLSPANLAANFAAAAEGAIGGDAIRALRKLQAHIEVIEAENSWLHCDVENLRDTLSAVTGGWKPPEALELVITFRPGRVDVCTDRSVPVLVSSSYPIVEG